MLLTCILARVIWTSERGIWRSEVRFLMGIQNFFFVLRSWQDKKKYLSLFFKFYKTEISSNFLNSKRLFSGLFTHQMDAPWETKIEIENPQIEYADGKTNSFLDSLFSAFLAAKGKEPDASFSFRGREKLGKLEKIHKNKFLR